MNHINQQQIRSIVFDLDGTLYVSDELAASIKFAATGYLATITGKDAAETASMMAEEKRRLMEESEAPATLSAVCHHMGGTIQAMHAYFEKHLKPESCLVRDMRVIELLNGLKQCFSLYIYTNNNRVLATRIIDYLGLGGMFRNVFTIDDNWRPKPDETRLEQIFSICGHAPAEILFVGDRYDVDLRLPEQYGCPVFLAQNIEQLLRLQKLLSKS